MNKPLCAVCVARKVSDPQPATYRLGYNKNNRMDVCDTHKGFADGMTNQEYVKAFREIDHLLHGDILANVKEVEIVRL
jgi:hypothetical protein